MRPLAGPFQRAADVAILDPIVGLGQFLVQPVAERKRQRVVARPQTHQPCEEAALLAFASMSFDVFRP